MVGVCGLGGGEFVLERRERDSVSVSELVGGYARSECVCVTRIVRYVRGCE